MFYMERFFQKSGGQWIGIARSLFHLCRLKTQFFGGTEENTT